MDGKGLLLSVLLCIFVNALIFSFNFCNNKPLDDIFHSLLYAAFNSIIWELHGLKR